MLPLDVAAIGAAGGFLPFDRYMDLALYAPGLGYYAAGATKASVRIASQSARHHVEQLERLPELDVDAVIKRKPGYTEAIGLDLGIIGPEAPPPPPAGGRPSEVRLHGRPDQQGAGAHRRLR